MPENFICIPKHRALRRFRQALGLGKVEQSSGQNLPGKGGSKWTGSSEARSTLWTYVNCLIEPQKVGKKTFTFKQEELRLYFHKRAFDESSGKKKRGRQLADARNATTRRLADKVFKELWKAWHD